MMLSEIRALKTSIAVDSRKFEAVAVVILEIFVRLQNTATLR